MKQDNSAVRVVIVGCGYVGRRLARHWQRHQAEVTTLSRQTVPPLPGVKHVTVDLDDGAAGLDRAVNWEHSMVYYCVPPAAHDGDEDTRLSAWLGALNRASGRPRCLVYFSTTAVYGDSHGHWVTEESMLQPCSARGRRRVAAERCCRAWHQTSAVPLTILRIAGIYGPDRLPLPALQAGQPVLDPAQSPYSNRIQVNDLTEICRRAAEQAEGCQIYNVSDGRPTLMSEYYFAVADRFGLPRPRLISWREAQQQLSPQRLEFLRESKRVANDKLVRQLGVSLRHADLVSGINQCFEEMAT